MTALDARCPLCASVVSMVYPREFGGIAHCAACEHRFSVFADAGAHRRANDRFAENDHGAANTEDRRLLARERLRDIAPYLRDELPMLELGCSSGEFLEEASNLGYMVVGIDQFILTVRGGSSQGIETVQVQARIEDYHPSQLFQCVAAFHVLEHLLDPVALVRRAFSWLLPGGTLYVEVPNVRGLDAILQGARWWGFTPDHASHFSARSLSHLLQIAGFHVETVYGSVS